MNYTIIAYLEDGVDTCRGCVMDRWSSHFEFHCFEDDERQKAIEKYAELSAKSKFLEYVSYDIICLFNGLDGPPCLGLDSSDNEGWESYDRLMKEHDAFREEARLAACVLIDKKNQEIANQKLKQAEIAKERERQEKLRTIERLQKELAQ